MSAPDKNVEGWRSKIDEIDRRLVELLNERSRCVIEIGRIKQTTGEALYQPDREKQVLDGVVGANPGPLPDGAIRRQRGCNDSACPDSGPSSGRRRTPRHPPEHPD